MRDFKTPDFCRRDRRRLGFALRVVGSFCRWQCGTGANGPACVSLMTTLDVANKQPWPLVTSPLTQLERGDEGPGWVASIRGSNPVNSTWTTNFRGTARGTGRLGTLPDLALQRKRGFLLVVHCSELSCVHSCR